MFAWCTRRASLTMVAGVHSMLTVPVRWAYIQHMTDLKTWMSDNSETDETLSGKLGISRVHVSRLRRKLCKPSPATAIKLERVTSIPAASFIFETAA